MTDISPGEHQDRVFDVLSQYVASARTTNLRGKGLCLVGDAGFGKTMLLSAVLNELSRKDEKPKFSIDALSMTDFVSLFHRKFDYSKRLDQQGRDYDIDLYHQWKETTDRLDRILDRTSFVLFDDVGKEYDSGSGWSNSQWDWYLRHRYNVGKPTLITSNIPVNEWSSAYSDSMQSFLQEACIVLDCAGPDMRQVGNAGRRSR